MKVTQILYSGLGGHGSVLFSMLRASHGEAIEHSAVFYGCEPLREEYRELADRYGLTYRYVEKRRGFDPCGQVRIFQALSDLKPDVIIDHAGSALTVVFLWRCLRRIPVVFVEHQSNLAKTLRNWICSTYASNFLDAVVYLSERSRAEVQEKLGWLFRPKKANIIPNGIDVDYFSPRQTRPENHLKRIGMLARMTALKDYPSLIRAMAEMKEQAVHLLLAGDGDTRPSLERLAVELGLTDRVAFVGMLDEPQLVEFLRTLDVYVHSTHGETMSTAIMQAMACGLPLIASNVSGISNQFVDGLEGVMVPPSDPQAIALAVEELLGSPERRRGLSTAARRKAVADFSQEKMWNAYRQLCWRLKRPPRRHAR